MFLSAPSEDGYLLNGEAKQALIFMILSEIAKNSSNVILGL